MPFRQKDMTGAVVCEHSSLDGHDLLRLRWLRDVHHREAEASGDEGIFLDDPHKSTAFVRADAGR